MDLHIKSKFQLCVAIGIVDLEESMHKLLQVDVSTTVEIKHCHKALSNDAWQLAILYKGLCYNYEPSKSAEIVA